MIRIITSIGLVLSVLTALSSCYQRKIQRAIKINTFHQRADVLYNKNFTSWIKDTEIKFGNSSLVDSERILEFNPQLRDSVTGNLRSNFKLVDLFSSVSIINLDKQGSDLSNSDPGDSVGLGEEWFKDRAYLNYKVEQKKLFPTGKYRLELLPAVIQKSSPTPPLVGLDFEGSYQTFVKELATLINNSTVGRTNAINHLIFSISGYYGVSSNDVDIRIRLHSPLGDDSFEMHNFFYNERDAIWRTINYIEDKGYQNASFKDVFINVNHDNDARLYMVESTFTSRESQLIPTESASVYLPLRKQIDSAEYTLFPLRRFKRKSLEYKIAAFDSLEAAFQQMNIDSDRRSYQLRIFPQKKFVLKREGYWEDVSIHLEDVFASSSYLFIKVTLFGKYAPSKAPRSPSEKNFDQFMDKKFPRELVSKRSEIEKMINQFIN